MADLQHLKILKKGVTRWNEWRRQNTDSVPDLSGADLSGMPLIGANFAAVSWKNDMYDRGYRITRGGIAGCDLRGTNLSQAFLSDAVFDYANLTGANLSECLADRADFGHATLKRADLHDGTFDDARFEGANLTRANLCGALLDGGNFDEAVLKKANLTDARLEGARLIRTSLEGADLTGARVYGTSVWDVNTHSAVQKDLIITSYYSRKGSVAPKVWVDDLEVAQFVYLLLENEKIRNVVDTIGKRAVLLLGRFTDDRKPVLELLRKELRLRGYLPIVFDFDPSPKRNLTETVSTLAHLSRFVIADITEARSLPQELEHIVPSLPSVPVQPLLFAVKDEYALFKDLLDYPWVLAPYRYESLEALSASLDDNVLAPVTAMAQVIEDRRKASSKSRQGRV